MKLSVLICVVLGAINGGIVLTLIAAEAKTKTLKICLWTGLICIVTLGAYVLSATFDLVDVLIYGGAVLLLIVIVVPYVYFQSKRGEYNMKLPAGYIFPGKTAQTMETVHVYDKIQFNVNFRLIVWFLVITASACLVIFVAIHSSEMRRLEKPLHQTQVRKIRSVKNDSNSYVVVCELWLCTNDNRREYRLIDSPSDGYFPDDTDGLVDSVSSRRFAYIRKDRSKWQKRPFEQIFYEVLTEKYLEAISGATSSGSFRQGSNIEQSDRDKDPNRYRYITLRDRKRYKHIIIVFTVFAAVLVVLDFFRRKCPECGRNWGLKKTGGKYNLNVGKFSRFRLLMPPDYTYEYQCSGCGHKEWIRFSINPFERT